MVVDHVLVQQRMGACHRMSPTCKWITTLSLRVLGCRRVFKNIDIVTIIGSVGVLETTLTESTNVGVYVLLCLKQGELTTM